MIENIKYAIMDIKKHKYYFIAVITYLTIFMIVSLMLISTVYQGVQEMKIINSGEIVNVPITPLSYDLQFESDYVDLYSDIIGNESFTYMPIHLNVNNQDVNGYIVLGDTGLLGLEINNSKRFEVYTTSTHSDSNVLISDDLVSMKNINLNNVPKQLDFLFSAVDYFVVYKEDYIKDVINGYSKIDSRYFYEFLLNTHISSLNGKGLESLKLLELEIDDIHVDDSMLYVYRNDEYNLFTYFMLLPLVLFLLVIGIISFDIIFKSILLSMIRELTIHLQSGAAKIDLQIRFITFYGILFIVSMFLDLVLLINLNIAYPLIILVATCINIILFVLCIFYINKSLNKQNIFDNLRGAYL